MASFVLPTLQDNDDGSWGPSTSQVPSQFKEIPYVPYSKSDKITHVADWSTESASADANARTRGPQGRPRREAYGASSSAAAAFGYVHDEDEKSFSLVDSGRAAAQLSSRGRGSGLLGNRGRGRGGFASRGTAGRGRGGLGNSGRGGDRGGYGGAYRGGRGRGGYNSWDKPQRIRDSSVTIGPEWQMLEEITFSRLQKLSLPVEQPEDLSTHGTIYAYDKAYDAVNTKNEKPLQTIDMVKYNTTTSEDPIILDLAQKDQATVFTTDAILSVLMVAPRSVNSWDIVITKENGKIYLDKREGGVFDFLTVNENAADPPADSDRPDDINSSGSLSLEATYINANFACQVVDDTKRKAFKNPNPFYSTDETEPLASCAYRYRKFDLSVPSDEDEFNMIVRTEVTAYQGKKDQYITIKALNEFDPKAQGSGKAPDWRTRLDAQRGAVVATEMKNNSAKLARWATQSLLAGAELMKVGFVSRANPKDAQRHVVVGMQSYKPRDFAAQMNISLNNGWGIVRMIVDLVNKQGDGRYVLVKDPNNVSLLGVGAG